MLIDKWLLCFTLSIGNTVWTTVGKDLGSLFSTEAQILMKYLEKL